MCGFVGIFNLNKDLVNADLLVKMRDIISHRGPDDQGIFIDHNLGLGFRRLSIIDIDSGHQPMTTADGRFTIVFNGEIYNYVELRQELINAGIRFQTHSDTEVILHLFAFKGEGCVNDLNGMFAFAIWDRERRELFFARDRIGIKPFYYYYDGERFVFGSEIKAIIADRSIHRIPNYEAIADYLGNMYVLGDKTFFKGIKKLLPGHLGKISEQHPLEIKEYWDLEFNYTDKNESQISEELRSLLDDAVTIHLRSDVPVGCHLSGGLDSSTITCLSAKHVKEPLKTFSGKFNEGAFYDETKYSKIVAEAAHTVYLETTPNHHFFKEVFPKLVWHMDEPCVGPGIIPQFSVCQLAASHVKVALGGQGGDEIFGGYPRYFLSYENTKIQKQDHARMNRPSGNKWVSRALFLKGYIQQHGLTSTVKKILTHLNQDLGSSGDFEQVWLKFTRSLDLNQPIMTNQFHEMLKGYHSTDSFLQYIRRDVTDDLFDKMLYHDFKTYLPGLLQVEDRTSMAVSLESRVPMLDYRIAEYAAKIPAHMKVKGLEPKYIFKQAIRGIIPDEVLNRKDKKGFPTPIHIWFKEDPVYVKSILLDDRAKQRGLFNFSLIEDKLSSREDYSWQLWSLLNVEMWFKIFIDEDPRYVDSEGYIRDRICS